MPYKITNRTGQNEPDIQAVIMNKKHKAIKQSYKDNELKEFMASLPFSESQFYELFDYLDEQLANNPCQHDYRLTRSFLIDKNIVPANNSFDTCIEFFIEHGGGCDCEVLFNVEEAFPNTEYSLSEEQIQLLIMQAKAEKTKGQPA